MKNNWKKQFITIYIGQAFSLLGSSAVQFAIVWWLTVQTESAVTLMIASIVAVLPNLLIGPFAGVWVDRFNRRAVLIVSDSIVALASAALGVIFLCIATPPVWSIYIILFMRGIGNTFHGPAMQATVPMLVPADMLTKAAGWSGLINSITGMLGPVLGAALMSFMPVAGIMLIDIAGAAFAVACLLFVSIPDVERREQRPHVLSDMRQGLRALTTNKPLMAIFLPVVLVNILFTPLSSLLPLLIRTHFSGGAWHIGVIEMVFAGGLLASSLAVGIWGGMKKRFLMASLAIGLLGAATFAGGTLPPGGLWLFAVCSFFLGGAATFINVPLISYTQQTTAPELMGKVISLIMAVMALSLPIGLLVAGPMSEAVGVDKWFAGSGLALMATAVLCRVLTKPYDGETMVK